MDPNPPYSYNTYGDPDQIPPSDAYGSFDPYDYTLHGSYGAYGPYGSYDSYGSYGSYGSHANSVPPSNVGVDIAPIQQPPVAPPPPLSQPASSNDGLIESHSRDRVETQSRRRINAKQTAVLEKEFQENPKPDKTRREDLADLTGLPSRTVQIWFQNRRAKAKNAQKAEYSNSPYNPTALTFTNQNHRVNYQAIHTHTQLAYDSTNPYSAANQPVHKHSLPQQLSRPPLNPSQSYPAASPVHHIQSNVHQTRPTPTTSSSQAFPQYTLQPPPPRRHNQQEAHQHNHPNHPHHVRSASQGQTRMPLQGGSHGRITPQVVHLYSYPGQLMSSPQLVSKRSSASYGLMPTPNSASSGSGFQEVPQVPVGNVVMSPYTSYSSPLSGPENRRHSFITAGSDSDYYTDEAPMLTPLSSLQSPAVSPEKRTPSESLVESRHKRSRSTLSENHRFSLYMDSGKGHPAPLLPLSACDSTKQPDHDKEQGERPDHSDHSDKNDHNGQIDQNDNDPGEHNLTEDLEGDYGFDPNGPRPSNRSSYQDGLSTSFLDPNGLFNV